MSTSLKDYINEVTDPQTRSALDAILGAVRADLAVIQGSNVINATTLAIGSTPENVSNTAFQFRIAGVTYAKAAVTAGTALGITGTVNVGTAAGFYYGGFRAQINASGTITFSQVAADQVYTSELAALTAIQALAAVASTAIMGYFVVKTKTGASWTAGTSNLTPGSVCTSVSYFSASSTQSLAA
jgi:hypothetical protein